MLGLIFGIAIASGVLGFVLLVLLTALWSVVYVGFMQLIALKTRSAAATNSAGLIFFPLLFLTPNFVPRDLLTRADGDRRDDQPRHLRDGGAALARSWWTWTGTGSCRASSSSRSGRGDARRSTCA